MHILLLVFLNQRKEENDCREYFMINLNGSIAISVLIIHAQIPLINVHADVSRKA